jgi:hypothetical protein
MLLLLQALALDHFAQAQDSTRSAALMRFACLQLTVERLNPLVRLSLIGRLHTHQIVGGYSFTADMKLGEYDLVVKSTCTTCTIYNSREVCPETVRRRLSRDK